MGSACRGSWRPRLPSRAVHSFACLHGDLGAKGRSVGPCLGGCYTIWTKAARMGGDVVCEVSRVYSFREEEPETTSCRQKIHWGMVSTHKQEALSHRSGGMDKRDHQNTGRATPYKFKRTRIPLVGGRSTHFPYQETSPWRAPQILAPTLEAHQKSSCLPEILSKPMAREFT